MLPHPGFTFPQSMSPSPRLPKLTCALPLCLTHVDDHTLRCHVGEITYIPPPTGTGKPGEVDYVGFDFYQDAR